MHTKLVIDFDQVGMTPEEFLQKLIDEKVRLKFTIAVEVQEDEEP